MKNENDNNNNNKENDKNNNKIRTGVEYPGSHLWRDGMFLGAK